MPPSRAKIVPRKEVNDPYPRNLIWNEDLFFLVFTHEFEGKIYLCPPKIFPPQSRYSGTGPGWRFGSLALQIPKVRVFT